MLTLSLKSEVPVIATLNLVIDMLQGAFRVEYGTKFVTVLGHQRVESVRQDLNYVGGYQDHLLRESVAVFPVDKVPICGNRAHGDGDCSLLCGYVPSLVPYLP